MFVLGYRARALIATEVTRCILAEASSLRNHAAALLVNGITAGALGSGSKVVALTGRLRIEEAGARDTVRAVNKGREDAVKTARNGYGVKNLKIGAARSRWGTLIGGR